MDWGRLEMRVTRTFVIQAWKKMEPHDQPEISGVELPQSLLLVPMWG
jgi:hypothetical protein